MKHESDQNRELTLVVGGTGALGKAITERLFSENHNVVVVGRDFAAGQLFVQSLGQIGNTTSAPRFLQADVTQDSSVDHFVKQLTNEGASVRLLVYLPAAPTDGGISTASIDAIMEAVNVKVGGLLRLIRGLEPLLTSGSAIVVLGGNLGYDPIPHAATSGIANAAVANAVRQLQFSLGEQGIRIHVVAPGPVDTQRWWELAKSEADARGVSTETILSESTSDSALRRLTTVQEIAWAVSTLTDPHAAALTGGTLLLDTGRRTASP
jgi:3-oxoacyl-[acyl-carrier protein] reductase